MKLTTQLDEGLGWFAEAMGEAAVDALIFLYAKPYRIILLLSWLAVMQFRSWADLRVMHDHDEYFYAYVEKIERRAAAPQ